jgi:hypothetical protein
MGNSKLYNQNYIKSRCQTITSHMANSFLDLEAEGDSEDSSDEEDDADDALEAEIEAETGDIEQKLKDAESIEDEIQEFEDDVTNQLVELQRRTQLRELREIPKVDGRQRAKHTRLLHSESDEELEQPKVQIKRVRETPADFEMSMGRNTSAQSFEYDDNDMIMDFPVDEPVPVEFAEPDVHVLNVPGLVFAALIVDRVITAAMICGSRSVPFGHTVFSVPFSKQDLRAVPHAIDPAAILDSVITTYLMCTGDTNLSRESVLSDQLALKLGYTAGSFVLKVAHSVLLHLHGKCATNDITDGVPSMLATEYKIGAIHRRNGLY